MTNKTTEQKINDFDNDYEITEQEYNKWLNERFQLDGGYYHVSIEPFITQGK